MRTQITQRRKQTHQFKETENVDPYHSGMKHRGLSVCSQCASVNIKGRWLSSQQAKARKLATPKSGSLTCPACRQLKDRFALGVIEIHGNKWKEKQDEVFRTLRNTESIARNRNDQQRVLWTQEVRGITKIYVTLPELARRIGRTLERSFQGVSEYKRSSEEPYLRVRWWSDLRKIPAHKSNALRGKEQHR